MDTAISPSSLLFGLSTEIGSKGFRAIVLKTRPPMSLPVSRSGENRNVAAHTGYRLSPAGLQPKPGGTA